MPLEDDNEPFMNDKIMHGMDGMEGQLLIYHFIQTITNV
jgi:hypothetical protein